MNLRIAQAAAALSVVAFSLWLASRKREGGGGSVEAGTAYGQEGSRPQSVTSSGLRGSQVPCAVPLPWRLEAVDPRFGMDVDEAREAVRDAGRLWEEAVGRRVFLEDRREGMPIRFVYDARQDRTRQLGAWEEELAAVDAALRDQQAEVQAMEAAYVRARGGYEEAVRALEARLAAHNDSVRLWNERGGAPARVHARLEAAGESLDAEAERMKGREEELEDERLRVQQARDRLEARVEARNRRAAALEDSFPAQAVEDGLYRETVQTRGDRIVSIVREIRIFRFDDPLGLRRILAHELGHALGLGHTEVPGALMTERYARSRILAGGAESAMIGKADLALLRARCPELVGGG